VLESEADGSRALITVGLDGSAAVEYGHPP